MHEFESMRFSSTIRIADLYNKVFRFGCKNLSTLSMINGLLKSGSSLLRDFRSQLGHQKDFFILRVEGQLDILNMRINKVSYKFGLILIFAMEDPDRPLSVKNQ